MNHPQHKHTQEIQPSLMSEVTSQAIRSLRQQLKIQTGAQHLKSQLALLHVSMTKVLINSVTPALEMSTSWWRDV